MILSEQIYRTDWIRSLFFSHEARALLCLSPEEYQCAVKWRLLQLSGYHYHGGRKLIPGHNVYDIIAFHIYSALVQGPTEQLQASLFVEDTVAEIGALEGSLSEPRLQYLANWLPKWLKRQDFEFLAESCVKLVYQMEGILSGATRVEESDRLPRLL